MKKISTIILGALMAMQLSSCKKVTGEGPVVTEIRDRGSFSGVDLRLPGKVYLTQDSVHRLEVRAQQNIMNVLETYVADNRLVIRFRDDKRVRVYEPVTVVVSTPVLRSVSISGSGSVLVNGTVHAPDMELLVSGSGDMEVQHLVTDRLGATVSGSGSIRVHGGTAGEERLRISGSGDIDLPAVAARTAGTVTSGSGSMRVWASERLDVTISGSGSVYYRGAPFIYSSVSGSGRVVPF